MTLPPPSDITWRNITTTNAMTGLTLDAVVSSLTADVPRLPAGEGVIVEGILPPLSAMHFLAQNAWESTGVIVFAGLLRDPAAGGDDTNARGGVAVFDIGAAGEYIFPPHLIQAPRQTAALRVVEAEDDVLTLSDGAITLRFDLSTRTWAE